MVVVITIFRFTPYHSYYCCGLLSSESFLGRILWLLCISLLCLDDVSMTSLALLTGVVLTSSRLLEILLGVALIGLGGVTFVFLMVSPKFNSTFLVLPNSTPYSESELLSLYWHFLDFLFNFLRAFSSLSNFWLNCVKFCLAGLGFFPPFLVALK